MSIGTFFIVYRVYYQQRRIFRSRRSGATKPMGLTPNKAKSLFYLLFTLNLLYFILVSPVVFVTTILFRNRTEELAYPRLKAIVYLMQYCNHSLNFIFYGLLDDLTREDIRCLFSRNYFSTLSTNSMRMVSIINATFTTMLSKDSS